MEPAGAGRGDWEGRWWELLHFSAVTNRNAATARPIISRIRRLLAEGRAPLLVALDGQSGAGKSTLAARIAEEIKAVIVDGDDFYAGGSEAQWDVRTARENAEHCIDWRRLRSEALEPLLTGDVASWHPFDWETGHGLAAQIVVREPADCVVLDGAYCARPELTDLIGLSVLLDAPAAVRRERLVKRHGAIDQWYARWDEAEGYYFTHLRPPASFDLVVSNVNGDERQPMTVARRARTAPR